MHAVRTQVQELPHKTDKNLAKNTCWSVLTCCQIALLNIAKLMGLAQSRGTGTSLCVSLQVGLGRIGHVRRNGRQLFSAEQILRENFQATFTSFITTPKDQSAGYLTQFCIEAVPDATNTVCMRLISAAPNFVVNIRKSLVQNVLIHPLVGTNTDYEAQLMSHFRCNLNRQMWCCVVCSAGMAFGVEMAGTVGWRFSGRVL